MRRNRHKRHRQNGNKRKGMKVTIRPDTIINYGLKLMAPVFQSDFRLVFLKRQKVTKNKSTKDTWTCNFPSWDLIRKENKQSENLY